ncbi:hypothetical protein WR25_15885 isoform A [Diploscapter pachys]|uniref:SGNH hydrolase-type esterase domain-containing protein n=2 Tax=Diploscapter pachys TaxID=2018661 RepID=A0A2A2LHD5_9BILA|nr:hypothetical protein WR25_15885 isoform A [Diploscapter pachys]
MWRSTNTSGVPGKMDGEKPVRMPTFGSKLECDASLMKPSETIPENVNKIRPADIKAIGAMGDSLTIGAFSKNYVHERNDRVAHSQYPGISWATGVDESLENHTTIANILLKFNPNLKGGSTGEGYGPNTNFNKAVGGMTAHDLKRQANELVEAITKAELASSWKLITLFIGTNDIGPLNAYHPDRETVSGPTYREKLHEAVGLLKTHLPNSIVAVMPMWNSQICIDSTSLLTTGKRATTPSIPNILELRDALIQDYKKAAFELPDKFHSDNFTVVICPFLEDLKDAVRNKKGEYNFDFYAGDTFHLSKYGNAVIAKWFWNSLFEPVNKKSTKVDLTDETSPLKCPDKNAPYIRTIGNS